MNTTIDLKVLSDALKVTASAVGRHPHTKNVLLETAGPTALRVSTSDGGLTVRTIVPATTTTGGVTLVEHGQIKALAKGKGTAELVDDGDTIMFRNGAVSTLARQSLDEFRTNTPARVNGDVHVIDVEALASVLVAASRDEAARPILCSVAFQDGLMIATDSYRLHTVEVPGQAPAGTHQLVPAAVLTAVVKAVKKGSIGITFGEDWAAIVHDQTTWTTRLVQGEFPNWRQLIPQGYPNEITFDPKVMGAAVNQVADAVGARQSNTPVRIEFHPGTVTVSCAAMDAKSEAEVAIEGAPTGTHIAFTPKYFTEAIDLPAERVTMQFLDALKPALITFRDDPISRQRLLMPVRTP